MQYIYAIFVYTQKDHVISIAETAGLLPLILHPTFIYDSVLFKSLV